MNTQKLHKIKQINKLAAKILGPFAFVAFLFLGVIAFAECIAKMFLGLGF